MVLIVWFSIFIYSFDSIDLARKLRVPLYLAWHSKFGAAASKARELAHECYNEG